LWSDGSSAHVLARREVRNKPRSWSQLVSESESSPYTSLYTKQYDGLANTLFDIKIKVRTLYGVEDMDLDLLLTMIACL